MDTLTITHTALALLLAAAALTFGWRSLRQRRLTGSTGWRFRGLRPLSLEWNAGALFALAVVLTGAAPIVDLMELSALPLPLPVRIAGLLGMAASTALVLWAQLAMGTSWRIGVDAAERTTLIKRGPFALVRNPIFSALWLLTLSLALAVPNVVGAGAVVVLAVALELQVRAVEEPYLKRTHGADYADYAAGVGRFFPGLGRIAQRRS